MPEIPAEFADQFAMLVEYVCSELEGLGVIPGAPFTPEHERQLAPVMPKVMIEVWRRFGFAGFDEGRFWLCDPLAWKDATDAWTGSLDLELGSDDWWPVRRSALGHIDLWGPRTGPSLMISTLRGEVYPSDHSDTQDDPVMFETGLSALLGNLDRDSFDLFDNQGAGLFEQCLAKLGPVSSETMYTFAPVPALGGQTAVGTAVIEQAVPHVMLLATLEGADVKGDIVATRNQREAAVDDWIGGDEG
ncbi:GAD-like domain-containing protein [Aestuariimicrobium soli]|uniref:GAD-like domain-containing protein n=1 Tax=Aestuariimicrobium soli TaxID=2035834 RepID=UPI003EBAA383